MTPITTKPDDIGMILDMLESRVDLPEPLGPKIPHKFSDGMYAFDGCNTYDIVSEDVQTDRSCHCIPFLSSLLLLLVDGVLDVNDNRGFQSRFSMKRKKVANVPIVITGFLIILCD